MKKLNGKSMDLVQENIKKLKEIFPEVFVEGEVNFGVLRQIFGGGGVDTSKERYSLNWNGKSEARQRALEASTGTLRPAKEESKNWDNTENIYIEGDNLEVLKLLQKSYHRKIKMIYIDPPYNTGKDFVYKDNFKDNIENYKEITGQVNKEGVKLTTNTETNGRYHSDWLSMMYPRLKLARNLLTDDGVIFISIDDNEQANLKKLCDEIFGEENFITTMIIKKASQIATENTLNNHEYLYIYTRNIQMFQLSDNFIEIISRGTIGNENQTTPIITFPKGLKCYNLEDGIYEETRKVENSKENIENLDPIIVKEGRLEKDVRLKARWRSPGDMRAFFKNNCEPTKTKINGDLVEIYFENDKFNPQLKKVVRKKFNTLEEMFYLENKRGSKNLDDLEINYFDNPKYVGFIMYLLMRSSNSNKKNVILDFFSGSSTTAHSVMQLNAEDGGNRKYIMVQLPELCKEDSEAYKAGYKNICEIGKERIRRAGDKIKEDETLPLENREKLDIGFKVFKLDSSNIKEWDTDTNDLQQSLLDSMENIKSDRNSLDVLYEILLKYGLDLNIPIKETENFYSIGGGTLLVSLNNEINLDVINPICEEYKRILEINKEFKTTVILRDNSFKNDVDKTNALKKLEQVGISEIRSI